MKRVSHYLTDSLYLIIGTFLAAVGIFCFLTPNKLSVGGVSAIGTVLFHLWGINLSVTTILLNGILFIFGYRILGKTALLKTVLGIVLLSAFLELAAFLPVFVGDTLVAAVVGGALVGVGVGLVVRRGASTGGSDFLAFIFKRFFPHISLADFILIIDCSIVLLSGLVFRQIDVTVFSVLSLYLSSKVTDSIITMGTAAKTVTIISEQHETIAEYILHDCKRGATALLGRGMFSGQETPLLWCVVTPKEVPLLIAAIRQIDHHAFITVQDTKEVFGNGFHKT